nr:hypothetical protein [Tanacetum cinerariifolium]
MNHNFYNSNSSGFDQTQPPQFPVIHPPPQETSIKILHDQENVINAVQTFLRKFNRYSFLETPKVLLLAWDRVFEIKDPFGNKQYKPEDIQDLFRKLLDDLENIHEELAEYIISPGWNRPAFYDDDDDDDDDVDYTIAITPVLSTKEPDNSLSIGDEHLDTILATKSDEVIKSSVEDLIPIPSESEGILDTMCDVHLVNNPTPLEAKDHFEYVEVSAHDSELVSLEVAKIVIPEDEEIKDDNLREKLLNVNLLIAKIEELKENLTPSSEFLTKSSSTSPKFFPPTDRSNFTHEEFADELAHIISPPEYDCFYFRDLPDPGEWISSLNSGIRKNLSSTTFVNLPVEDDHSPLLAYVIWIFLAYLTYHVIPLHLHSFRNEDTIFDLGITINRFYSFKPAKNHLEIVLNSNDDISSSDDDSLHDENIKYVEASPHDSELVSLEAAEIVILEVEEIEDDNLREKLLNVHLLIANIEALKDNPTQSSELLTKSSSTSLNSLLEETNTFHNSLPEFKNFCFDLREISSGRSCDLGSTLRSPFCKDENDPEYDPDLENLDRRRIGMRCLTPAELEVLAKEAA